mgnify:CR=1 FL=1
MRTRGFEPVEAQFRQAKSEPRLPLHATRTSAGYDFYATEDLSIAPGEKAHFPTDLKAYMQPNEMLLLIVRSSMGIRQDLMAANTAGIVDSDYYGNPDNDGNLIVFLRNLRPAMALSGYRTATLSGGETIDVPIVEDLRETNTVHIRAGERVIQGIFVPVLPADQGADAPERSGGFGSSGK